MNRGAVLLACLLFAGCTGTGHEGRAVVMVKPGDDIQKAVDLAALTEPKPIVRFAPGYYFPRTSGQALLHLNRVHDGLTLEADGEVTLSASNPALASPAARSFPAVVNHVIYLGEGISSRTVIRGFHITGARGFLTRESEFEAEPDRSTRRTIVFYSDGGGVKVFGHSSPVLENLVLEDNLAFFCGGGISVEQQGKRDAPVIIRNSRFLRNRAPLTGAALDVLPDSWVRVEGAEFSDNVANYSWMPLAELQTEHDRFEGISSQGGARTVDILHFGKSSALTVFAGSRLYLNDAIFTRNSGGVDFSDFVDWYWKGEYPPRSWLGEVEHSLFMDNRDHALSYDARGCKISLRNNFFAPAPAELRDSRTTATRGVCGIFALPGDAIAIP